MPSAAATRPMRVDAQRNYDAIVQAASREIDRVGAGASLEDIARKAGVGSATLHRRFRSRRELLQAVFADRIREISARASTLSSTLSAGDALRAWLLELTEFSASTRGVADTLILDSEPDPTTSACEAMLVSTATTLHTAAVEAGEISARVTALDLLALVNSISLGSRSAPDPTEYAVRLLGLALTGIGPKDS
jgi:AcrR family transcriptional regulator